MTDGGSDYDRLPPQDLEAEQATLGSLLLGGDTTARIADLLRPEDFYRQAHGEIYRACLTLFERGEPVDVVSVASELRARDRLESTGGFEFLDRLCRATPYSQNVERYARVVHDKSLLRRLLFCSQQISESCFDGEQTAREVIDGAQQNVLRIAEDRSGRDFEMASEVAVRVWSAADERSRQGGDTTGTPTGYPDLDRYLSGLQGGDLVILAARPSMGKTSLAICMALHAAVRAKLPVAIFSLEMSKESIVEGMICTLARVNLARWRSGNLSKEDWWRIAQAMQDLSGAPLYIDDTAAMSPMDLRARARRLRAETGPLGLLVIDYLQLMHSSVRRADGSRVNEISDITRALKGLAKELQVPVMTLSQLSRAVEQRTEKKPMLSDLRESGQIEADADVVLFLYREKYYEDQQKKKAQGTADAPPERDVLSDDAPAEHTELSIAKQRNGPTGKINLGFQRQFKLFVSWSEAPPSRG
ncbi:MAG: replicative DNA helicase [Fimbriimonadaceae bacterium]|nr:replicative DNA helicase [Fimbriimonadaceae bacterium]